MNYIKKGPNRLLQVLILGSLGIHTLVFIYGSGIFRPKVVQYIELTLKEKKPLIRAIPRPPKLQKEEEKPDKPKKLQISPIQLPDINQVRVYRGDDRLTESISEGGGRFTQEDYIEMVRLRIDRQKIYPKGANGTYKEGVVTISFVITLNGDIRNLKIVKPCPYEDLNKAAVQAVRDSVPFSKPPPNIFKNEFEIELNVTFDLI